MIEELLDQINHYLDAVEQHQKAQEGAFPHIVTSPVPPDQERPIIVYLIDASPQEPEERIVEASTGTASAEQSADDPKTSRKPLFSVPHRFLPLVSVVGCLLILLLATTWLLVPLWTPTATITIIPVQQLITAETRATIVTNGTANAAQGQLPGRLLPALTLTQARTVATTGVGQQQAHAARGLLTFYNAAQTSQLVPAGTLLTTAQGVQLVTDQDALIPPAVYPTFGQVTIPAHTLLVGPGGNLAAGVLNGPCCRENVFVVSHAFTGGQDARSYPMVSQHDRDDTIATLKAALDQSVNAAYQAQLEARESLLTPVACTSAVSSDHQVGEEATSLTITVVQTCEAEAYETQAVEKLVTARTTQVATSQLGTGYALVGAVETSISQVGASKQPGSITVHLKATGVWAYQFSQDQLARLTQELAGKSKPQAMALLLHTPGIKQVVCGERSDTFPTDATHLHLAVLYEA